MKSLAFVAMFVSTAAVAADLPSRSVPLPPVRSVVVEQTTPFFVGVHLGASNYDQKLWSDRSEFRANVRAGYEFSPFPSPRR